MCSFIGTTVSRRRSYLMVRFFPKVRRTTHVKRVASIALGLHKRKLFFFSVPKPTRIKLVGTQWTESNHLAECAKIMDPTASRASVCLTCGFIRRSDFIFREITLG
jgi:hypothetical protein